jgi:site-specific recombinase XerD
MNRITEIRVKLAPKSDKTTKLWVAHGKQVTNQVAGMKVHKFLNSSLNLPEGFTFHCFRHYHATQLLLKGINVKEVSNM